MRLASFLQDQEHVPQEDEILLEISPHPKLLLTTSCATIKQRFDSCSGEGTCYIILQNNILFNPF